MNQEHKDIKYFIPFGESIHGFANQSFVPKTEINNVLRNRGIFVLNREKTYTVPILQTLLLSPKEFDQLRNAYTCKEDKFKTISREIDWTDNADLSVINKLPTDINNYVKAQLPTCELKTPIQFVKVGDNFDQVRAEFTISRHDINKSWYEQTNEFSGSIEFINENGRGRIVIKHTAPETKTISEQIVKIKVKQFKDNNMIPQNSIPKRILFNEFNNIERFAFFYRLTSNIQDNNIFIFKDIKDISIKPDENCDVLPEEIEWMKKMKRIIISGDSLGQTFFMKDKKFHESLILWHIVAIFDFEYKGEKGSMIADLGFPDYTKKGDSAEFEISISLQTNKKILDTKYQKKLVSELQSEFDKQKSLVYNNFTMYLKQKFYNNHSEKTRQPQP